MSFAGFMGLNAISQQVGLHPSACRTSAGLSAMDLAGIISDEWRTWRFGCEAECCGLTWTSATLATALGLGKHYRMTELRDGVVPQAGRAIEKPGHYSGPHKVYSDRNTRPYTVTSDGSVCETASLITPDGSNQIEVVSPPMTFANGDFEDWVGVLHVLRGLGAVTGTGEGGHVHIDAAPLFDGIDPAAQRQRLDIYLAEFARWEPLIMAALAMHPQRRYWAEPTAARIQKCRPELATSGFPGLMRCWRPQGEFRHFDPRYRALNLMNSRDIQNDNSLKNTLELRLPNGTLEPARWMAYVQLALALGVFAKTAKRVTSGAQRQVDPESARYDFRVWLLALGLSGPEFKVARDRLITNLPGDAAWKPPKKVQPAAGITGANDPGALFRALRGPAPHIGPLEWAAHPDDAFWMGRAPGGGSVRAGDAGYVTVQKTTEGRYLPVALAPERLGSYAGVVSAAFCAAGDTEGRMATINVGRELDAKAASFLRSAQRALSDELTNWQRGFPTLTAAQAAGLSALQRLNGAAHGLFAPAAPARAARGRAATAAPRAAAAPPWQEAPPSLGVLPLPYIAGGQADALILAALRGRERRKIIVAFYGEANNAEQAAYGVNGVWQGYRVSPAGEVVSGSQRVGGRQTWLAEVVLPNDTTTSTMAYLTGLLVGADAAARFSLTMSALIGPA